MLVHHARRALSVAIVLLAAGPVGAEQEAPPAGAKTPKQNFSDLHDAVEWVTRAFTEAKRAADEEDWAKAVRHLHPVVTATVDRDRPTDAAPYLRPVRGRSVYEGAWIVAHHTMVRWGAACLAAYEAEFGAQAREELRTALRQGRHQRLVALARQYLPLRAGRTAALLLADLALEAGRYDEALEWVELLEDLEAVSTEPDAALEAWRKARLSRHARALADPDRAGEVLASLRKRATRRNEPDRGLEAVPFRGRSRMPPPQYWPTTGGNAARAGLPEALGTTFELAWWRSPSVHGDLVDSEDPKDQGGNRPSTWLPPRAIVLPTGLFVSDGQSLHLYDLERGQPVQQRRYVGAHDLGFDVDDDRRIRFGWLEGHGLTGRVDARGTTWIYAAVPDGRPFEPAIANRAPGARDDRIEALTWDGRMLRSRWTAGGMDTSPGMPLDVRLYGAPLLYRDRLWVAGMRPAGTSSDRWEAWLFALDPETGRVAVRTHIGTGTPVRPLRQDEVIPTSPSGARGRVVVGTSLGIVAAVDARDGRMRWAFRNDRNIQSARRLRGRAARADKVPRGSSFANEPPVLAGERCYIAPIDGQYLYMLFNRPIGDGRMLLSKRFHHRKQFNDFEAEALAGVAAHPKDGIPLAIVTGQGINRSPPAPVVVARDVWPPRKRWSATTSTGLGAATFGRALVTRGEVIVPTRAGIEVYDLASGAERALLDLEDVPDKVREELPRPYGNIVPVPGRGFVAVSTTSIAFWKRK